LIHQLNPTASLIWEYCDGQSSVDEIAGKLALAFDIDSATAIRDTAEVIIQFQDLNLLETFQQ
jgi:hypothetical protein